MSLLVSFWKVSFKKYMPPPLPYFKINICPFPLPHFASIFFAYLWSSRRPNYIVTLPIYFSFRLPHLNVPTGPPVRRIGQEYSAYVAWSTFQSLKRMDGFMFWSKLLWKTVKIKYRAKLDTEDSINSKPMLYKNVSLSL